MATIHFVGHLGKDAEHQQYGTAQYANFSVAETKKFRDKDGGLQERTMWYTCQWRDDSGNRLPYLTKGTKVSVSGTFFAEDFQGRDGQMHTSNRVIVSELDWMSKAESNQTQQQRPQQNYQQRNYAQKPQNVMDMYQQAAQQNKPQRAPQTATQPDEELPF